MALISIQSKTHLASPVILAPERYDPRRQIKTQENEAVELGEIVISVKKMVKSSVNLGKCFVLDTSDAREGIVIARKQSLLGTEIGSTKKEVKSGDVIISRLRPYLRQVAFIDEEIPNANGTQILCSTEFFVLRSIDNLSIAFLVPFLLSNAIQEVLAASQEGGHHPRFTESALLTLPIPKSLLSQRSLISEVVRNSVQMYRASEKSMSNMVEKINATLS
jgi:hypothetical protein